MTSAAPSTAGQRGATPQIPQTMRAAVLFGPKDMRVVDKPVPQPGPNEVLVKVAMCGMCGTDIKIYEGHFPQTPPFGTFTPGHEWTGTVVALGAGVDEFAIGDRVCIEAHHGCGKCDNCLIGKYTACLNYGDTTKGHRTTGITADGGFAQYVIHHVSALYRMPESVSFADGVLLTTAGTGLYGLNASGGYIVGQDVVIFGPGAVGLMTLQAVRQMGARKVILVGTRDNRLQVGKQLGADHVINVKEQDPVAAVHELTDGGAHLVIETSGSPVAPQQCVDTVRRGGKIIFVAFYPGPVTFDLSAVVRNDVTMYTTRGEGANNVQRAVALAEIGKMTGEPLITHRFPLEEVGEALRVITQRDGDPIKVVLEP